MHMAAKMFGALGLGLITLVIAFIIFVFSLPILIPLALGTVFLVAIFFAIWGIAFTAIFIGVAIYYFFKPMKISRENKNYSIVKAKEAGKRQKSKK